MTFDSFDVLAIDSRDVTRCTIGLNVEPVVDACDRSPHGVRSFGDVRTGRPRGITGDSASQRCVFF